VIDCIVFGMAMNSIGLEITMMSEIVDGAVEKGLIFVNKNFY
jgi:hypothetical protein